MVQLVFIQSERLLVAITASARPEISFSTHLSIRTNIAFLAHLSPKLKHRSNGLKMQTNSWDTRKTINRIGMREANGLLELFLGQLGKTLAQSCSLVTLNFTGEVTRGKSPFFMWSTIYQ